MGVVLGSHDLSPALPLEGRETFGASISLYVSGIINYFKDSQIIKEFDLAGLPPPLQGEGRGEVTMNRE